MINEISLQLFTYCNLNCSYCYIESNYRNKVNIFNRYNELVNFISNLELDNEVNIVLCGSEPSLYFNEIYNAYKRIKKVERKINTKIKFGLYTNGTDLEGIISLLDKDILIPEITNFSWDGVRSSLIRNSINLSYNDEFFNNKIKILGESKFRDKVCIRTAISPDNINYLYESVEFLIKNGCVKWEYYFLTDCEEYRSQEFINKFKIQLEKIIYLTRNIHNFDFYNLTNFINTKEEYKEGKTLGCKLGSTLGISIDGLIYPCGFFTNGCKYNDSKYLLGNISEKFDKYKLDNFIHSYNQVPTCDFRNCSNYQCFECIHPTQYRNGDNIEYRVSQVCLLRDAETEVFNRK